MTFWAENPLFVKVVPFREYLCKAPVWAGGGADWKVGWIVYFDFIEFSVNGF